MLYDANFRLDESVPKFLPLDFEIVELIRRNEKGDLSIVTQSKRKLVPIILRTIEEIEGFNRTIMALPFGGDCVYCFTDPKNPKCNSGGFIFENGVMYFAKKLLNLEQDRDSYRQRPSIVEGNYVTDLSFKQVIKNFQEEDIPLFRTVSEDGVYYDKKSWPNREIPNYGNITYEEAFRELGL